MKIILKILITFFILNFILAFFMVGVHSSDQVPFSDKFLYALNSVFSPFAFLLNFMQIVRVYPVAFFGSVILILVGYYFYNNRKRISGEINSSNDSQPDSVDSVLSFFDNVHIKKVILIFTITWFLFQVSLSTIYSNNSSEGGIWFFILVFPVMASFLFYPVYFIILSIRYLREGRDMHIFDKSMFYLLLFVIISYGGLHVYNQPARDKAYQEMDNKNYEQIARSQQAFVARQKEEKEKEKCFNATLPEEIVKCFYGESMRYIKNIKQEEEKEVLANGIYAVRSMGLFSGGPNNKYIIRKELRENQDKFYDSNFYKEKIPDSSKRQGYQYILCEDEVPKNIFVEEVNVDGDEAQIKVKEEFQNFEKTLQVYLKKDEDLWKIYKIQCPL